MFILHYIMCALISACSVAVGELGWLDGTSGGGGGMGGWMPTSGEEGGNASSAPMWRQRKQGGEPVPKSPLLPLSTPFSHPSLSCRTPARGFGGRRRVWRLPLDQLGGHRLGGWWWRRGMGGCPKPNIAAAVGTQPSTRQGPAKVRRGGGEILGGRGKLVKSD